MQRTAQVLTAAIAAALCVTSASAATPTAPASACKWDHREFQNLGNGDYTLSFAPLAADDDRGMGGYLGYLTIRHPLRGQIYNFDLFQGNGYATVKLMDHKNVGKKQSGKNEASAPLELYEFDDNLHAANGSPATFIFIPRLGQTDYYNGRPAEGTPPIDPRDPKFRLNDNLWKFVGCR